jgi:hypothetical protein
VNKATEGRHKRNKTGKKVGTIQHCVLWEFGTTEGEKEWLSGSYATPNEALGFFEFLVGEAFNFGFRPSCSGAGLRPIGRSKIPEKR